MRSMSTMVQQEPIQNEEDVERALSEGRLRQEKERDRLQSLRIVVATFSAACGGFAVAVLLAEDRSPSPLPTVFIVAVGALIGFISQRAREKGKTRDRGDAAT